MPGEQGHLLYSAPCLYTTQHSAVARLHPEIIIMLDTSISALGYLSHGETTTGIFPGSHNLAKALLSMPSSRYCGFQHQK